MPSPIPTRAQQRTAAEITAWYLRICFETPDDPSMRAMFSAPERVGHVALNAAALRRGDGHALQCLLVACVLFQRQRDVQVLRILRGLSDPEVAELTDLQALLLAAKMNPCPHSHTLAALHAACDLAKDEAGRDTDFFVEGRVGRPASASIGDLTGIGAAQSHR